MIYIIGNSHVLAIAQGLELLGAGTSPSISAFPIGGGQWETSPFSTIKDGRVTFTQEVFAKHFRHFSQQESMDPMHTWGICMGTHNGRVYRDNLWVIAEPGNIAVNDKRPISDAVISTMIENDQKYVKEFILNVKRTGARCFIVSSPPPRIDYATGNRQGIRSDVINYIDRLGRRMFRRWTEEHDIDLIEPPPQTYTADGFLKLEFCRIEPRNDIKDLHHGNEKYGALMLERVLAYLSSKRFDAQEAVREDRSV